LYNLASALAGQGKYQQAVVAFRHALALHPGDERTLNELGAALENSGDWHQANQPQQAVKFLEGAVKQRPKYADTREQLADAYALSGRVEDAAIQLKEAIALSPDNPDLHALLLQALAGTGHLQQAITERKAALHLRPNDADDWNNLGVLEAETGKIAEAREDLRHALQLAPDHAQARANLDHLRPS